MNTKQQELSARYNAALAELLDLRKNRPGHKLTYPQIEQMTGLNKRRLLYLFTGKVDIHMGDLLVILDALGMDPGETIKAAFDRVDAEESNNSSH